MSKRILAAIAVVAVAAGAATSASAGDLFRRGPPERYAYGSPPSFDAWGYGYEPRGYYPYYNSGYWVPRKFVRYRYRYDYALPPYYQAWGFPRKDYQHRSFHYEQYGGHWPWNW